MINGNRQRNSAVNLTHGGPLLKCFRWQLLPMRFVRRRHQGRDAAEGRCSADIRLETVQVALAPNGPPLVRRVAPDPQRGCAHAKSAEFLAEADPC